LGTITAIAIGNRFHGEAIDDKCTMLVINAEGVCHEFRIPTIDRDCYELAVEPVNNWPVPVNISRAVIADGTLIVGRTDRIIHLYRLDSDTNQLIQTAMYVFPGQLGTIVPLSVPNRSESIIFVAQPGAPIYLRFRICHYIGGVFSTLSPDDGNIESFPASAANATADILATEMAITTSRDELVLCTMGGQMRFFHLSSRRMRSVALDQQLFALASLPYSKQPQQHRNPIVACAWNGDTFIVDGQTLDVVKFQFGERVCAFTAGEGC
jgi:hypothetical protein